MKNDRHEYERVATSQGTFFICLDCGAVGMKRGAAIVITHYKNCTPHQTEKWDKYYKENEDQDEHSPK